MAWSRLLRALLPIGRSLLLYCHHIRVSIFLKPDCVFSVLLIDLQNRFPSIHLLVLIEFKSRQFKIASQPGPRQRTGEGGSARCNTQRAAVANVQVVRYVESQDLFFHYSEVFLCMAYCGPEACRDGSSQPLPSDAVKK